MSNKKVVVTMENYDGKVDEVFCKLYKCPNCENAIRRCFNFCTFCGARLEWRLHTFSYKLKD